MTKPVSVACGVCEWKGKRRPKECCCYDEFAMYCACLWGHCPRCNGRVCTAETMKLWSEQARIM